MASRICFWFTEIGVKQIHISPDVNYANAVHADKWIPVLPNTDAALQLAIAYTWIKDGTFDQKYLDTHAVGFENFKYYVLGGEDGVPKTACLPTLSRRSPATGPSTQSPSRIATAARSSAHASRTNRRVSKWHFWACRVSESLALTSSNSWSGRSSAFPRLTPCPLRRISPVWELRIADTSPEPRQASSPRP